MIITADSNFPQCVWHRDAGAVAFRSGYDETWLDRQRETTINPSKNISVSKRLR
jgi:hypothetical protein